MEETGPKRICGAKKRGGGICQAIVLAPNGRCRLHGGSNPRGVAHPRFKHGKYSTSLPERLALRYQERLQDPDLLSLGEEVILVEGRIEEVLSQLSTGETGELWFKMVEGLVHLEGLLKNGKTDSALKTLDQLQAIAASGVSDQKNWAEVGAWLESKRRLAETEMKRRVAMKEMATTDQLLVFQGALLYILKEEIQDREQLARLSKRIRELGGKHEDTDARDYGFHTS